MRSRILVGLLAGAIGGLLGWFLQEGIIDYNGIARATLAHTASPEPNLLGKLAVCVGGMIGLFLGAVDGIVEGSGRKTLIGGGLGAFFGVFLSAIGIAAGDAVFVGLGGKPGASADRSMWAFAVQVAARCAGWSLMGAGIGVGASIGTRSPRRVLQGAVGGLIGGFAGGFIFDIIAPIANPVESVFGASGVRDAGGPSRAIGFIAIGGLSGLAIGLVQELFKTAWVRVLAGRNEGRDFILGHPLNILGRDERCDVPLFGDSGVGVQHAAIKADGKRHLLVDAGVPLGSMLNGQRVEPGAETLLRDGDMIQIGSHRILFREKATASTVSRPATDVPGGRPKPAPGAVPMPSHLCPFCGGQRDASGNCLCSVPKPAEPLSAPPVSAPPAGTVPYSAQSAGSGVIKSGLYANPTPGVRGRTGPTNVGDIQMARLVGIEGPYSGEVFFLTGQNNAIGRGADRDIVLSADQTVSRNHAHIGNEGGDLVIYDDGSSNGTFVNGMRVTMQVLVTGDIVQLGQNSKFRFE
jgi:pSer/pThr/pTyr-binding forkhead associated (FHA) protein